MILSALRPALAATTLACGLVVAALTPTTARAQADSADGICNGPSLLAQLSPDQEARLQASVAATPYAEGLLWEARRGDAVVTLMGTLHVWDPRIDALIATARPALTHAQLALFEMTPTDEGRLAAAIANDPTLVSLPDNQRLPDVLDPETWNDVQAALRSRGMPPGSLTHLQPWFLANLVAIPSCAMTALQAGQNGVDHALMAAAIAAGVPLAPLEPWDSVLRIFGKMALDDQIAFLRLSLVQPDLQDALFVAMIDGYFAGRVAEIWELNTLALDFIPELAQDSDLNTLLQIEMLDARNHDWLPVITQAAATHKTIFVGAGAAHLPGDDGLLSLLAADGWTITRLH